MWNFIIAISLRSAIFTVGLLINIQTFKLRKELISQSQPLKPTKVAKLFNLTEIQNRIPLNPTLKQPRINRLHIYKKLTFGHTLPDKLCNLQPSSHKSKQTVHFQIYRRTHSSQHFERPFAANKLMLRSNISHKPDISSVPASSETTMSNSFGVRTSSINVSEKSPFPSLFSQPACESVPNIFILAPNTPKTPSLFKIVQGVEETQEDQTDLMLNKGSSIRNTIEINLVRNYSNGAYFASNNKNHSYSEVSPKAFHRQQQSFKDIFGHNNANYDGKSQVSDQEDQILPAGMISKTRSYDKSGEMLLSLNADRTQISVQRTKSNSIGSKRAASPFSDEHSFEPTYANSPLADEQEQSSNINECTDQVEADSPPNKMVYSYSCNSSESGRSDYLILTRPSQPQDSGLDKIFVKSSEIYGHVVKQVEAIAHTQLAQSMRIYLLLQYLWNSSRLEEDYYDKLCIQSTALNEMIKAYHFEPKPPVISSQCPVCGTEETTLYTAPLCDHSFCKDCWSQHIQTRLEEGKLHIGCMEFQCSSKFIPEIFLDLVCPGLVELYRKRLCMSYASYSRTLSYCPNERCDYFCSKPICSLESMIECLCGRFYCFRCKREPHQPATCQQVQKWQAILNSSSLNNDWISQNTRQCPKCKTSIEKAIGCDKLLCLCGTQFCFKCGRQWEVNHSEKCGQYQTKQPGSSDSGGASKNQDSNRKEHSIHNNSVGSQSRVKITKFKSQEFDQQSLSIRPSIHIKGRSSEQNISYIDDLSEQTPQLSRVSYSGFHPSINHSLNNLKKPNATMGTHNPKLSSTNSFSMFLKQNPTKASSNLKDNQNRAYLSSYDRGGGDVGSSHMMNTSPASFGMISRDKSSELSHSQSSSSSINSINNSKAVNHNEGQKDSFKNINQKDSSLYSHSSNTLALAVNSSDNLNPSIPSLTKKHSTEEPVKMQRTNSMVIIDNEGEQSRRDTKQVDNQMVSQSERVMLSVTCPNMTFTDNVPFLTLNDANTHTNSHKNSITINSVSKKQKIQSNNNSFINVQANCVHKQQSILLISKIGLRQQQTNKLVVESSNISNLVSPIASLMPSNAPTMPNNSNSLSSKQSTVKLTSLQKVVAPSGLTQTTSISPVPTFMLSPTNPTNTNNPTNPNNPTIRTNTHSNNPPSLSLISLFSSHLTALNTRLTTDISQISTLLSLLSDDRLKNRLKQLRLNVYQTHVFWKYLHIVTYLNGKWGEDGTCSQICRTIGGGNGFNNSSINSGTQNTNVGAINSINITQSAHSNVIPKSSTTPSPPSTTATPYLTNQQAINSLNSLCQVMRLVGKMLLQVIRMTHGNNFYTNSMFNQSGQLLNLFNSGGANMFNIFNGMYGNSLPNNQQQPQPYLYPFYTPSFPFNSQSINNNSNNNNNSSGTNNNYNNNSYVTPKQLVMLGQETMDSLSGLKKNKKLWIDGYQGQ